MVDDDGCTNACRFAACGDGIVQVAREAPPENDPEAMGAVLYNVEMCDDGNVVDTDDCRNDCTANVCGDGVVNEGVEQCDDGNNDDTDGCTTTCVAARCGDGIVQADEACDDGNADDTDACRNACSLNVCGDGVVWRSVEQCDDGNDHDGCRNDCTAPYCGDGVVRNGVEQCDDGNTDDTDGCRNDCTQAYCGDGIVEAGVEECDDANLSNLDGCLVDCRIWDACADTRVDGLDPSSACVGNVPEETVLSGSGFLRINGVDPIVTFDGETVVSFELEECTPIFGVFEDVETCTTARIDLDPELSEGEYPIVLENRVDAMCGGERLFVVTGPPEITSIVPSLVCEGDPSFDVFGTNLSSASTFILGETEAISAVDVADGQVRVTFPRVRPGVYDLTVQNGEECATTAPLAVEVVPDPRVFFVDPEIIWTGISVQSTIYVANINAGAVTFVGYRPAGSAAEPIPLADVVYDVDRPGEIQARIPSGLTVGEYEIVVIDGEGCIGESATAFRVTNDLTLAIDAVSPPFGWTETDTSVRVLGDADEPGEVGFQVGARVYASPDEGTTASVFESVGWVSEDELTTVVPAGLTPGVYDVIAVNPDGSIGVLDQAFTVLANPTPLIDSVTPASIPTSSPQPLTIVGSGLANGAATRLFCQTPGGGLQETDAATTFVSSQELETVVPAVLTDGTVCVVRVTNPDTGYGEFSAIGVTTPAENIPAFALEDEDMATARRYPAVAVGSITRTSRRIYAMGGDSGAEAGALDSVEVATLDRFGAITEWRSEPQPLPEPLTYARAVEVDGYVYLVGGSESGTSVADVWRAAVLLPADSPQIEFISLIERDEGLAPGVWYYRVTAVRPSDDDWNPGGETLASEPQPVRIPEGLESPLELTLNWNAVDRAVAYRVYRTPNPDMATGMEELIAEVSASELSYTDAGDAATGVRPPALGDLGEWAELPALNTPRAGFGLAAVSDPVSTTAVHLYAFGGRDGDGDALSTIERLTVDTSVERLPTTTAWTESATGLTARWTTIAHAVDPVVSSRVPPDERYLYVGSGLSSAGTIVRNYDVAEVLPGGALGAFRADNDISPQVAGHAGVSIANQLFAFGGQNAGPSNSVQSSYMNCGATCPDLTNWNAAGISLVVSRYLATGALGSGRIFVVGGQTNSGPSSSVESTVW